MNSILIIDDEKKMREALVQIMEKEGYSVVATETGEDAIGKIKNKKFDLVITDLKLPGINGIEVLKYIQEFSSQTNVILITAYATVDTAIEAMKLGAEDYIMKPFNLEEIRLVVKKVFEKRDIIMDNVRLREQLKGKFNFGNIVGKSEAIVKIFKIMNKIKDSNATVLVLGETGTGKELVARAIHFNSVRSENPFVPINCCALSESLLESQLFGYTKGAFTGAYKNKQGIFEFAEGGTVFLDEIGDIGAGFQQTLLRVLESGEIQPVGANISKKVDVRIIAATNQNLEKLVKNGTFREDLYYRLNVIPIEVPPLRNRKEDIALLANSFLNKYAKEYHKNIFSIKEDAMTALEEYPWPGNVRELENIMARAILLETEEEITLKSMPEKFILNENKKIKVSNEELQTLEEVSKLHIKFILEKTKGNKTKASEILGLNRTSLWRIMQRLNLDKDE